MHIPITEILQKTSASGHTENIMMADETFRKKSDNLPIWRNKFIFMYLLYYNVQMFYGGISVKYKYKFTSAFGVYLTDKTDGS